MRKDCLKFHQFETIALMPCFSVNLFLKESDVFCQFVFRRKINFDVLYPTFLNKAISVLYCLCDFLCVLCSPKLLLLNLKIRVHCWLF